MDRSQPTTSAEPLDPLDGVRVMPGDASGCWLARIARTTHLFDFERLRCARVPDEGRKAMPYDRDWLALRGYATSRRSAARSRCTSTPWTLQAEPWSECGGCPRGWCPSSRSSDRTCQRYNHGRAALLQGQRSAPVPPKTRQPTSAPGMSATRRDAAALAESRGTLASSLGSGHGRARRAARCRRPAASESWSADSIPNSRAAARSWLRRRWSWSK
jgi:hypothetical protein